MLACKYLRFVIASYWCCAFIFCLQLRLAMGHPEQKLPNQGTIQKIDSLQPLDNASSSLSTPYASFQKVVSTGSLDPIRVGNEVSYAQLAPQTPPTKNANKLNNAENNINKTNDKENTITLINNDVENVSTETFLKGSMFQLIDPSFLSRRQVSYNPAPMLPIAFSFEVDVHGASFYRRLFPDVKFDCFRSIIPWIKRHSIDAGRYLDGKLPIVGPVVARDLGFLLASLVYQHELKDVKLPILFAKVFSEVGFLHFDASTLEPIHVTIAKLIVFDGYVGANIDPMHMISTAANVGATSIAANEAASSFRNMLNAMVEVTTVLTPNEQEVIRKERALARFTATQTVSNDHPLMCAYREIIRDDFQRCVKLKNTTIRTLILGATTREYRFYNNNPHIFFQFAIREGKDTDRVVVDCLESLRKIKRKKASKTLQNVSSIKRQVEGMVDIDNMLRSWRESRTLPARFLFWEDTENMLNDINNTQKFDQLIFQDVGYNFNKESWGNLFRRTGALVAYGYMCLPWELLTPDIISPPGYVYKAIGEKSYFAYHGYSNGYCHNTNDWATLMRSPALIYSDFSLGIEFISRIGPMTVIKLYKTLQPETFIRNFELPEFLRTTRILNIRESFDRTTGELKFGTLVYFPIRTDEFQDAVNYGLDIAKESVSFNNILLFIRRRCSGISLVSKELSKTWTAPKGLLPDFALVVYLYVMHLCHDFAKFQEVNKGIIASRFSVLIHQQISKVTTHVKTIYDFFKSRDLFHLLTIDVDESIFQTTISKTAASIEARQVYINLDSEDYLNPNMDLEEKDVDEPELCYFCMDLKEALADQIFTCARSKDQNYTHEFTLSNQELTVLKSKLSDTVNDPIGLKAIKEEALKRVPVSTFSCRARVHYLCGPPGTGKSHAIRSLATSDDLVVAPFSRLKQDYTNFIHPITGVKTSLKFYTQHVAFGTLNHSRVFVDEYTAMPYECLAIIVNNSAAHEVFLVGDHRQTAIIHEVEGISVPTKINLSEIREHELIKNFRNPKDAVNVLNTLYNYKMLATNDKIGYKFAECSDYAKYPDHTPLFFRYATAERFGIDIETCQKVTVRANQGATYDRVKLIVTNDDKELFTIPAIAIVALSRHKEECVILFENTSITAIFIEAIKSVQDQPTNISFELSPIFNEVKYKNKLESKLSDKTNAQISISKSNVIPTKSNKVSFGKIISTIQEFSNPSIEPNKSNKDNIKQPTINRQIVEESKEDTRLVDNDRLYKELKDKYLTNRNTKQRAVLTMPEVNICLLQSLADLTTNTLDDVWASMVSAIGVNRANQLYNVCWSTDELNDFCIYNNIIIHMRINQNDEIMPTYGKCGPQLFGLQFSSTGLGHFYTPIEHRNRYKIKLNKTIILIDPEDIDEVFYDCNEELNINYSSDKQTKQERNKLDSIKTLTNKSLDVSNIDSLLNDSLISNVLYELGLGDYIIIYDEELNLQNNLTVNRQYTQVDIKVIRANIRNQPEILVDFRTRILRLFTDEDKINIGNININEINQTGYFTLSRYIQIRNISIKQLLMILAKEFTPQDLIGLSNNKQFNLWSWRLANMLKRFKALVHYGGSDTVINSVTTLETPTVKQGFEQPLANVDSSFIEMARLYTDPVYLDKLLVEQTIDEKFIFKPLEQTSFDAFKMLVEDFATIDEYNFVLANQESLEYIEKDFGTGIFDITTLDSLNKRGHPKSQKERAWSLLNVSPGITYFKANLPQSLYCLQSRYLTKAYRAIFDHEGLEKAREIADLFFQEHMSINFDIFNEQDIFSTTLESEHAMKIKNYDKQTTFDLLGDNDVRFSMKDIFKPFKTKIDLFKAGQGISAWSKDNQTIFQTSFRIINKHFINSLKPHVVYDNGIDEHTLMMRVNSLFSLLPNTAINGVIDATACDSGQNTFTQMIERCILEKLEINEEFLNWYYRLRQEYVLKGYGVTAKINGIKTSGEPATLLNNTILMAALMNFIIRGEGPAVLVIKGDDGLKRQSNMLVNKDILPKLKRYLKMDFKIDIDIPITFCGYFLNKGVLLPDLIRKVFKILGHRFHDYKHFTEYQQSLRDWVLTVNKIGVNDICYITSTSYNITFEYSYCLFQSIVSLTHINERQFYKLFIHKEYDWNCEYPTTTPWKQNLPWYTGEN